MPEILHNNSIPKPNAMIIAFPVGAADTVKCLQF